MKASLVSVHDAGLLSSNGCAYLLRFLRTALGMITHTANNAANATPPSNTSISTPPIQKSHFVNLHSILKQACFNSVAQMLNNCYKLHRLPPPLIKSLPTSRGKARMGMKSRITRAKIVSHSPSPSPSRKREPTRKQQDRIPESHAPQVPCLSCYRCEVD